MPVVTYVPRAGVSIKRADAGDDVEIIVNDSGEGDVTTTISPLVWADLVAKLSRTGWSTSLYESLLVAHGVAV